MSSATFIWTMTAIIAIVMFILYMKAGGLIKSAIFTAFTGIGALGLLWIAGRFIAVPVNITPLSIAISAILGVPGVLAMLIIHLI